jgi:hypothetical protein
VHDHSRRQLKALLDVSEIIARHRDLKTLFHELAVACIPSSTPISLRSCRAIP